MSELFINKKVWESFSESEMEEYVTNVFSHYRQQGFPYFPTDQTYRQKEFSKFMRYDDSSLYSEGMVKQTMHGLGLLWSYFPHSFEIRCNNAKTPLECFNDDEMLLKVIRKRIRIGDNMSDNGLRKMIKMFSGVQSVSNFRPTAASAIYQKFTQRGDTVYDMSSGFGGRLLGAHKAGVSYIGVDPSVATYKGLTQLISDFDIDAQVHLEGSENFTPSPDSLDFAFTSPPYFDTEKYSEDEGQSYIRYSSKEVWLNEFLAKTFRNVKAGLKHNKYMVVNIADVKSYTHLVEDTVRVAQQEGFTYLRDDQLLLSNSTFKKGKSAYKSEPLLIFKKVA